MTFHTASFQNQVNIFSLNVGVPDVNKKTRQTNVHSVKIVFKGLCTCSECPKLIIIKHLTATVWVIKMLRLPVNPY